MHDVLQQLFALVCGQLPTHTWAFGGESLPFCQRCTGLYAGAAFGLALHLALRPRPSSGLLWFHGLLLVQMIPQGFHLVPQTPLLRLVSGHLFGIGVVAYLWLAAVPERSHRQDGPAARNGAYSASVAVSLGLVTALVYGGGTRAGPLLSVLGLMGFVAFLVLVAVGLARGAAALRPAGRRITP